MSCQFSNYNSKEIITCLVYMAYGSSKYISIASYYIDENYFSVYNDIKHRHVFWDDVECIKSAIGEDLSKSLFCLYQTNGEAYCLEINYNIVIVYYHSYQLKCRNKYYAMKVNYFSETDQFAFSCII